MSPVRTATLEPLRSSVSVHAATRCCLLLAAFALLAGNALSQERVPLKLVRTIRLPGIEGDFDHFALDLRGHRLFLAEEDHHTVEVFDSRTFKSLRSIAGFARPHWLLYLPESNQLFVTDGPAGAVKIFKADSYRLVKTIPLGPGADCIAYDPATRYLYVTYGGRDARAYSSSIAIISTASGQHLGDISLPAVRLEGMAIGAGRLFVNIASREEIAVIDLQTRKLVATWSLALEGDANVPMRLDKAHHRLLIATRTPSKFIVVDANSGRVVSNLETGMDADDIFYDPSRKRVYVSCGEGFVEVFQQKDPDHYQSIARIPTGSRARDSFFSPELDLYFVPVPGPAGEDGKVLVYRAQ